MLNRAKYYALKMMMSKDKFLVYNNADVCFSQSGEDVILSHLFGAKKGGFYVDIGAHHPFRKSNTAIFYHNLKWKGINIDAQKDSMRLFNKYRPNDINLEIGINKDNSKLDFYTLGHESSAMNTFSEENLTMLGIENTENIAKREIITERLDEILEKHLPPNKAIDFMSIDVEGFELNVLKSNNWEKFRPKVVAIEILNNYLDGGIINSTEATFLAEQGYKALFKLPLTYIFIEEKIKLSSINQII